MSEQDCPCGGFRPGGGPTRLMQCPKCGRIFVDWTTGGKWEINPTIGRVDRAEESMRLHFNDFHRDLRIIKRLFMEQRKAEKPKPLQYFPSSWRNF